MSRSDSDSMSDSDIESDLESESDMESVQMNVSESDSEWDSVQWDSSNEIVREKKSRSPLTLHGPPLKRN